MVTVSFIEGLLALFAEDKEEFCKQINQLLKRLHVPVCPGRLSSDEEEEVTVGNLHDVLGLPEMWYLREFYRALTIDINDRKRLLKEGVTEANQLVNSHFLKTFCKPKNKSVERTRKRYDAQLALSRKKLVDFESKTKDVVEINGLIHDVFWSAVKFSFPGLRDHEHLFGVCGDNLRVSWFRRAA